MALTNLTVDDPNIDAGTLSGCPIASLAVGATQTCTATRAISQAQIDAGTTITNTATPSATGPDGTTPVTEDDTPNDNSTSTTVATNPNYTMKKTSDTASISAPGTITYSFEFVNTGNVALTNLTVADPNIDAGTLSGCPIASLAVGATQTCTATRAISQAQIDAGTMITNTATPSATGSPIGSSAVGVAVLVISTPASICACVIVRVAVQLAFAPTANVAIGQPDKDPALISGSVSVKLLKTVLPVLIKLKVYVMLPGAVIGPLEVLTILYAGIAGSIII